MGLVLLSIISRFGYFNVISYKLVNDYKILYRRLFFIYATTKLKLVFLHTNEGGSGLLLPILLKPFFFR